MNSQNDDRIMRAFLRAEAAVGLLVAVLLYARTGGSWLMFGLLFFVPDLSMLGYLGGSRVGAVCYNIAHMTVLPALLFAVGLYQSYDLASAVALTWLAHIFFDRTLGYGLKHRIGFAHTHLGTVTMPSARKQPEIHADAK
jgi:hypothetical protein